MANVQRYRSGPQRVVTGLIDAGDTASIGDLVGLAAGYVFSAAEYSDSQTAAFHDLFLGVLIEGATNGDETSDTQCVVAISGDFEFDCAALPANKITVGQAFGPADGGSTLDPQTVAPTLATTEAIGKLARQALAGDTTVVVSIRSVVMDQPYA